ncbi:efflux RND transporter periplasmic adaptor subunit [Patescibacteria group bacterium]
MNKIVEKLRTALSWFKAQSLIKKVIIIVMIALVIFFLRPKSKEDEVSYQFGMVEAGSVSQIVSETGAIMSTGKTEVTSTITGIVDQMYVDNGGQVIRNQELFRVVSSATEEERALALKNYLSAQATLKTAQANQYAYQADMFGQWDDFKNLAENDTYSLDDDSPDLENRTLPEFQISEKDWLASEVKYKAQEQTLAQAKAGVSQTWLAYQATIDGVVKAPISGVVANLSVASGQEVNGSDSALMISSGNNQIWVILSVSEADVITLASGQSAEVAVDALRGQTFEAKVERVDEFGTESSGVVTYNVYLVLSDSASTIRPNMTVQVDILTQSKEDVLVVPNSAVKPYQGGRAVQAISPKSGQIIYLPVEIGIVGETQTEIISGLKTGQEIIIGQGTGSVKDQGDGFNGGIFRKGGGK